LTSDKLKQLERFAATSLIEKIDRFTLKSIFYVNYANGAGYVEAKLKLNGKLGEGKGSVQFTMCTKVFK
jgi:hypothetical protein